MFNAYAYVNAYANACVNAYAYANAYVNANAYASPYANIMLKHNMLMPISSTCGRIMLEL